MGVYNDKCLCRILSIRKWGRIIGSGTFISTEATNPLPTNDKAIEEVYWKNIPEKKIENEFLFEETDELFWVGSRKRLDER